MIDVVNVSCQYACGFAGCPNAIAGILDRRLHLRVLGIGKMTEVGCQIAGPDEEAIDSIDCRDSFYLRERGSALQLHDDARVQVCALMIIFYAPIVVGARPNRDSSHTQRRIARSGNRRARLIRVLYEWNDERAGS